ncbi:MAG TPA: mycothiol system anti-sigma-R factor [Glycomyces sp.]|nr:mycothiol system anti-sigma-R factor [Glycomyces sp.]
MTGHESSAKPNLDCREVLEEVYLYIDGECSDVRRSVIRTHLDECSPCLSEYGIEQEVRAIVHRCCSKEQAPDDVKARLRRKLNAIEQIGDMFSETAERER